MSAILLVDIDRIKKNSYLDGNIDDKTIKIGLINAQEQLLEPVIGTKLYNKLTGGIAEGTLPIPYQNLVINYIWKVLYHGTTYMVARNLLVRYTNSAIVKDSNQNSTAVGESELRSLRDEEFQSYQFHVNKLQLYLTDNIGSFPEYGQTDNDGLQADEQQVAPGFFYDGPIDNFDSDEWKRYDKKY